MSDPLTIFGADLLVWCQRGVGLYDAVVGGSLITVDGTQLGRWEDQSGNGYHLTRASAIGTGSLQVSTTTKHLGANTVKLNTDTVAYLSIPDAVGTALAAAGQGEIAETCINTSDTGGNGNWLFDTSGIASHYLWSDGHWYEAFGSTTRKDCGDPTFDTTSAFHMKSVWSASGDFGALINNGAGHSFTTASNTVGFRTTGLAMFADSPVGGYARSGNSAEIVIAKRKATAIERAALYAYMATGPASVGRSFASVII